MGAVAEIGVAACLRQVIAHIREAVDPRESAQVDPVVVIVDVADRVPPRGEDEVVVRPRRR